MNTCAWQAGFGAGDHRGKLARQRLGGGFVGQVQGQGGKGGGHGAGAVVKNEDRSTDGSNYRNAGFC